jgi:hypothetical protein
MHKKSPRTRTLKKALAIGFLVIFLSGFFIETIFILHDFSNTELVDQGEESDEEKTDNSKKEWNDDFISLDFTFRVILIDFSLIFKDYHLAEFNQLQSVFSPPPDLI